MPQHCHFLFPQFDARRLLRLAVAGLLFGLLAPSFAVADTDTNANGDTPPASEPVQQVEVKGQYNARRQDTATKSVISHEEITRHGDTNLLDVLKRLPSITVVGNTVRMRGLGEGYTQILLNGEKTPAGFVIESLAPDAIEKIEILHAASAEMSTQAIAGTINIITRNAVRKNQREMKFSLGNEGGKISPFLNLQSAGRDGNFSRTLVLALAQSHFNTPTLDQQLSRDAAGAPDTLINGVQESRGQSRSIYFNPRLSWNLDQADVLTSQSLLRYSSNESDTHENNTTIFGIAPAYAESNNFAHSNGYNASSNLNWVHHVGVDSTIDAKFGLSFAARNGEQQFFGQDVKLQNALTRQIASHSIDAGFTVSGKLATNLLKQHTMVFGWDGAYQQRADERSQNDLQTLNANTVANVLDEQFSVRVNRLALFAQDEWNVTPLWSAYLGLRWEGVRSFSSGSMREASSNHSSVLSPISQTLWKLPNIDGAQVRLALARTYKAPVVGNLNAKRIKALDNTQNTPDYQGNPRLRPELAWGLDLAFEYFAIDGGLFSVSAYARCISDVIGHRLEKLDGRWVSMLGNEGQAESHGIALEVKFDLQNLAPSAPAVEVHANVNRNWSKVSSIQGPNNRLDGQTPLSLNLGLDYIVPQTKLNIGASFDLQTGGEMRTSNSETTYRGVQRNLDMLFSWKRNRQQQVRLALSNLLHQDVISGLRYDDTNGRITRTQRANNAASARLTFEQIF